MKIKQSILLLSGLLLFSASFAQGVSKKSWKTPVIIAELGIKNIYASDDIDVLLINTSEENVKASVPDESRDKVKISYSRGDLKLASKGNLAAGERIAVYVYVSELQSLNLSGNATAVSRDILDAGNLKVNIKDDAKVSLRNRGKMKVNAPENYHKIEEERYHLLLSTE